MVPLSKSGVRKHRGFESRPLRHSPSSRLGRCRRWFVRALAHAPSGALALVLLTALAPTARADGRKVTIPVRWLDPGDDRHRTSGERSPSGLWRRTGNAVRGNPSRVRIPPSPPPPRLDLTRPGRVVALRALAHAPRGALALVLGSALPDHVIPGRSAPRPDAAWPRCRLRALAHAPRGALALVLGSALPDHVIPGRSAPRPDAAWPHRRLRALWPHRHGPRYPSRAVLGGELAVPCTCNPLQQG